MSRAACSGFVGLMLATAALWGAEPPAAAARPEAKAPDSLSAQQRQLAAEFQEFEKVLVRMCDLTRANDPRRAMLLEKTLQESSHRQIDQSLDEIGELLQKEQFAPALDGQAKVAQDLRTLLDLLVSENPPAHRVGEGPLSTLPRRDQPAHPGAERPAKPDGWRR